MNYWMKHCAALTATVLLGGCTQYDWYKEGASYEQKHRQVLSCEAGALKALPPNMHTTYERSETTGSTNCEAGVKDSCGKKNKVYTDKSYSSQDVNEDARRTLVQDCMYQQGWREIEINR